jgi:hypothetical protein
MPEANVAEMLEAMRSAGMRPAGQARPIEERS